MNELVFMDSLFNAAAPPCEKYECENLENCRDKLLACESFSHYVHTGHSPSPRTSRYAYNNGKIFATGAILKRIYQG